MNKRLLLSLLAASLFFVKCNVDSTKKGDTESNATDSTTVADKVILQNEVDTSTFIINASTLAVVGIIQSAGLTTDHSLKMTANYQLISPKRPFFLISEDDLTPFWGMCVKLYGTFPEGWAMDTENIGGTWTYGRSALKVDSVRLLSGSFCDAFQNIAAHPDNLDMFQDTVRGVIIRMERPAPDIDYDYAIALRSPIPHPEEPSIHLKTLPVNFDLKLDKINQLVTSGEEVLAIGRLTAGYAESQVFVVAEIEVINK